MNRPRTLTTGQSAPIAGQLKKPDSNHKPTCNLHRVKIIETEASIGCGLRTSTAYELAVELSQIVLQQDNKVLLIWPFKHVRRYGYTSNSFSIEAGCKCATGEGLFIFRSPHAIQLYNQAIASVEKIKQELLNRQHFRQRPSKATVHLAMLPADQTTRQIQESSALLSPLSVLRATTANHHHQMGSAPRHYVRNDCEYAQVVKQRQGHTTAAGVPGSTQSSVPRRLLCLSPIGASPTAASSGHEPCRLQVELHRPTDC